MRSLMRNVLSGASTLLYAAAVAVIVAGCGGSGGSPSLGSTQGCVPDDADTAAECGTVLVALTDAEGDFVSYSVDVLSVGLRRANGATVETLPAVTRVDFAQLIDMADLLSATTLAPGDFVGGTIRLDYGDAEVFVEAGGDIVPAQVVDSSGQPLGVVDIEIRLADSERLIVTRGRAAFLSVDFDLAASHTVDTLQSPALVTAEPYIVAEVLPVEQKDLRVRGALRDVDVDAGEYTIAVRPWHRRDGDHGRLTVHTTAQTSFEIGAAMYEGAAGLEALAALDQGTLTVAFGTLDVTSREFTAQIVHARDSVGGIDVDAVYGNVVARTGDQLTVKGAFAVRRDRAARFHRTVLVELGADTSVFKVANRDDLLDKDAISVGQRIVAFGQLSDPTGSVVAPVLDATQGRVRLLVTHLHGMVTGAITGQLNLRLRAIDRLTIELFDFTGTGVISSLDADPEDYEVATGSLSLDALVAGEAARVLGFVAPFGAAPPDFEARTVIDHRNLPATLGIGWGVNGTAAPFLSLASDGLVLDLANPSIGQRHHLRIGRRIVDLFDLLASPTIAPQQGRALFGISEPGHVELFADFADFVDELSLRLGAGDVARSLSAHGVYDESTNTVVAKHIGLHMLPAQ